MRVIDTAHKYMDLQDYTAFIIFLLISTIYLFIPTIIAAITIIIQLSVAATIIRYFHHRSFSSV